MARYSSGRACWKPSIISPSSRATFTSLPSWLKPLCTSDTLWFQYCCTGRGTDFQSRSCLQLFGAAISGNSRASILAAVLSMVCSQDRDGGDDCDGCDGDDSTGAEVSAGADSIELPASVG